MRFASGVVLGAYVWLGATCSVFAQTVPPSVDPGRIPQRFEQGPQSKALPRIGGIQLPSTVAPPNAASIMLSVARFQITGSTVYSEAALAELAAPLIGKSIPLTEVYALASRITGRYGSDGYVLSRAIVPPQTLGSKGAVVHIEIIEGYVDRVVWPDGLQERYRDFFTDYERNIVGSRPANIKVIERYLLLASDLPGLKFSSTFKPSASEPRSSTLLVSVEKKPIDALARIDNWGSKGRGPWQARAGGSLNNVFGQHESVSLTYVTTAPETEQLRYVEGSWKQVLTSEGLTFSFTGSYNTGIPGLPPLQALNYDSAGVLFTAMLSYPLIRTRDENLTLSGILFTEDVASNALGVPFTDDRLRGVRSRIDYDRADTLGGINLVQVTLSQGIEGLGSTGNDNPMPSRIGGRVDFTKVEATLSRTQPLPAILPGLSLYGALYGQYAWDPLLVVEQCSYGGKLFGRAFDPSALTGDNCINAAVEVRYDLRIPENPFKQTQLYGFLDRGFLERNTTSAGTPQSQLASSAGVGLRLGWRDTVSIGVEAARGVDGDIDHDWRGRFELTVRH